MTWPQEPSGQPPQQPPQGHPPPGYQAPGYQAPAYGPPPPAYGAPGYGPPPPPQPYAEPPPGYQAPAYGPYARPKQTNGLAIAAFVLSILGVIVVSVALGIIALLRTRDPSQGGRGLAIASLVISGVWAVVIAVGFGLAVIGGQGTVSATDVNVGDCIVDIPNSPRVLSVQKVSCDKPHQGEVYAVLNMPNGAFPGQSTIDVYQNKCNPELQTYSPAAMQDPAIGVYVLYPTPETWSQGDRAITCIATSTDKRTGSVKR
jgi:Septum formation